MCRQVATVCGHVREAIDERLERRVEDRRAELLVERLERPGHRRGVALLAVQGDHEMEDLVDEPHRREITRPNCRAGVGGQVALVVHLLREAPRGGKVGEDSVAGEAEQRLVKRVSLARRAGDVELEGGLWAVTHGLRPILPMAA